MRNPELMMDWYKSDYTGIFSRFGPVPRRPHDPAVSIWAATLPRWGNDGRDLAVGGAGWDDLSAEMAGVGEAIERWQCRTLPCDRVITTTYDDWPLEEAAIEPERWVLFHPQQNAAANFPFQPLQRRSCIRWVCCREAISGQPYWVPEEFVFLTLAAGQRHCLAPAISTGLSCGRLGDPVLLRGVQEVIERDALMGAWWGNYAVEEHETARVFAGLPPRLPERLLRPNLRYRCFRIDSPFSSHVTLVTLEGEDQEGFCFSVGSACRETRTASWQKAFLEAVQGRHFVRLLKAHANEHFHDGWPIDFAGHALYYSLHPEQLPNTLFHHAAVSASTTEPETREDLQRLAVRLGGDHPILFRQVTPPGLAQEGLDWLVLRVLVPGLQPMHGHHGFPFLGGAFWANRDVREWLSMLPHPFP